MAKLSESTVVINDGDIKLYKRRNSSVWQAKFKIDNRWVRVSTERRKLDEAKLRAKRQIIEYEVMGVAYFLSYQFIFVNDALGLGEAAALEILAQAQLITTVVTIVCTLASGWLSDRIGRRKPVVLAAGLLVAAGLIVIGTSASPGQFLIGAAIYGVGQGVYFAVDMALVAAVLPNPEDTAKDLGVFNIASTLPQSLAPMIAPLFLVIGSPSGQNLPAVFWAGAAFAVIGAFAVLPIRRTR